MPSFILKNGRYGRRESGKLVTYSQGDSVSFPAGVTPGARFVPAGSPEAAAITKRPIAKPSAGQGGVGPLPGEPLTPANDPRLGRRSTGEGGVQDEDIHALSGAKVSELLDGLETVEAVEQVREAEENRPGGPRKSVIAAVDKRLAELK